MLGILLHYFWPLQNSCFWTRFWVLFWLDLPLQGLLGSYWVTHRWGHHLPLIRAQLCQDWSRTAWDNWFKLDLGGSIIYRKWDKNDKKRLKNWRDHLILHTQILYNQFYKSTTYFYSAKYCTISLIIFWRVKSSKFEAGKIASKWYKMARSHPTGHLKAPQCFNGVSQWLKSSNTPFYKTMPHFTQFLEPVFTFKCSKFEARK